MNRRDFLQAGPDRRDQPGGSLTLLRFCRPGVEINLGSIGKGYALDRVAERLREKWGVTTGLLDGGTSSLLALGTPPGEPRGWLVGLKHPWEPRRLALLRLRGRALATS